MKVYLQLSWDRSYVAELSPQQLETFMKIMDSAQRVDTWYDPSRPIQAIDKPTDLDVRVLPARVTVLPVPAPQEPSGEQ